MSGRGSGIFLVLLSVAAVLSLLAVLREGQIPHELTLILPALPYFTLAAALFMGWLFNRSGVGFVALTLLGVYLLAGLLESAEQAVVLQNAIAVVVGANLLIFSLLRERGLFGRPTLGRWALLVGQGLVVGYLAQLAVPVERWLGPSWLGGGSVWVGELHVMALVALASSGVVLFWQAVRQASPLGGSFAGTWLALVVSLAGAEQPLLGETLFTLMGGLLILGVVLDSHRMAYRDELTGLPGRRALEEHLARLGSRYTIAMSDIDHFKGFNDTHGHDAGDQVLRYVATLLGKTEGGATAYRYGGEEFTLVFPRQTVEEARPHLEAVRETIAGTPFSLREGPRRNATGKKGRGKGGGKQVHVTISIGAAAAKGQVPPRQVMEQADAALYRAKDQGRDRVVGS